MWNRLGWHRIRSAARSVPVSTLRTANLSTKAGARPAAVAAKSSAVAGESGYRDVSLLALCKNRGFVYPSSEIYGGLSSTFDYGPNGTALKRHISDLWWRDFVVRRSDCVGIDSAIMLNPKVWSAAGHTHHFIDPLIECKACHTRHRADKLVESAGAVLRSSPATALASWLNEIDRYVIDHAIACPACGKKQLTAAKEFNLLFSTSVGPGSGASNSTYLRPETAQGIFINFPHLLHSTRARLPFGVGQIGKSFRNEISPRDFLFRTREFTQMELEYFCRPEAAEKHFAEWVTRCHTWLQTAIGIRPESLRLRPYDKASLAHYASATTDIEFNFPFGWGELWGIANRTDFDLKTHAAASGRDLRFRDDLAPGSEPFYPHVIEPAVGLDRLVYAVLSDAYREESVAGESEKRVVLKLHPDIAPVPYAVLPLSKKGPLLELSQTIVELIRGESNRAVAMDEAGSIGKRYRRFDEIGTPNCITVDFQSLADKTFTIRDRDTMKQRRVTIDELTQWIVNDTRRANAPPKPNPKPAVATAAI